MELIQLLQTSYLSTDNTVRGAALEQLKVITEQQPAFFVGSCCQFILSDQADDQSKVLILTALRSSIKPESPTWSGLNEDQKKFLQDTAFGSLISPNPAIKESAAYLISNIFVAKIKNKEEGSTLLQSIVNNVGHEDMNIKKSAVLTLSNICEVLSQNNITSLSEEEVDKILFGVCSGLNQYNDLTSISLKGLGYSIEFLRPKLESDQVTDFVYELVLKVLEGGVSHQDEDIVANCLNTLGEISIMIYPRLARYSKILQERVFVCKSMVSKKIVNVFQQFFIDLLELELTQKKGYFDISFQTLTQYCVDLFQIIKDNEELEEENSVLNNTLILLKLINQLYYQQTFPFLLQYVQKNFWDQNLKCHAIFVFDSMLIEQTKDIQELKSFLMKIFSVLVNSLSENQTSFERTVFFNFLVEAAMYQNDVLMHDQNFMKIIHKIISFFNNSQTEGARACRIQSFKVLTSLINAIPPNDRPNIEKLNSYANTLIDRIISSLQNEQELSAIDASYNAIYNLIFKIVDHKQFSRLYKKFF